MQQQDSKASFSTTRSLGYAIIMLPVAYLTGFVISTFMKPVLRKLEPMVQMQLVNGNDATQVPILVIAAVTYLVFVARWLRRKGHDSVEPRGKYS